RIGPGSKVGAGARVFGGPFVAELQRTPPSRPVVRPVPDEDASYLKWLDLGAFVARAATFLLTRSLSPSVGGRGPPRPPPGDAADAGANLRALRSGALPVRDDVTLRRPDTVLVASPRVLSDGVELENRTILDPSLGAEEAVELAVSVAAVAGWPWGPIHRPGPRLVQGEGGFDGEVARARIAGSAYTLPPESPPPADGASLVLQRDGERLAVFTLRPRIARNARSFAEACRDLGMKVALVHDRRNDPSAPWLAREAELGLVEGGLRSAVQEAAGGGRRVAVVTDAADEGEA